MKLIDSLLLAAVVCLVSAGWLVHPALACLAGAVGCAGAWWALQPSGSDQ